MDPGKQIHEASLANDDGYGLANQFAAWKSGHIRSVSDYQYILF